MIHRIPASFSTIKNRRSANCGAPDKTLSRTLKELENDGLIHREMYPEDPPKVEYSLTERGHSLVKVLDQLCTGGLENRPTEE